MTAFEVAAVDSTGQLDEVLGLSEHLRDALWRVRLLRRASGGHARRADRRRHGRLGRGRAAGARCARAAADAPFVVSDGYALPGWAGASTLVLLSSYSGTTEETLSRLRRRRPSARAPRMVVSTGGPLVERARRDGVPVIPVPAGFQPRAAIGYSLVDPRWRPRRSRGRGAVRARRDRGGGGRSPRSWRSSGARTSAGRLAGEVARARPARDGAGDRRAPSSRPPAAYRWKCEFNENAELPAFASMLPEADHNEIVGWEAARELGQVLLRLARGHRRRTRATRCGRS